MTSLADSIRTRLRAALDDRKELGELTQAELARRVGCSRQHLAYLLDGTRTLTVDWVEKIADALGVPVEQVLGEAAREVDSHVLLGDVRDLIQRGAGAEVGEIVSSAKEIVLGFEPQFRRLAKATRCDAAALLWIRRRTWPLYRWRVEAQEALGLADMVQDRIAPAAEWAFDGRAAFVLALKNPRSEGWEQTWKILAMMLEANFENLGSMVVKSLQEEGRSG